MSVKFPWNQAGRPIAKVNGQLCCNECSLKSLLKQALTVESELIDIVIFDPVAQRFFLPLVVYSSEEVLPQEIGQLVVNINRQMLSCVRESMHYSPGTLGISLALTSMRSEAKNSVSAFIAIVVITAIGKGYGQVSFSTSLEAGHGRSGSVVIRIVK